MKRGMAIVVAVSIAFVLGAAPVAAQQPAPPGDPHHAQPPAGSPSITPPAPGPGAPGRPMSMEMCRQMMGGSMMEMPMASNQPMDPRMMASMMEMRGEMMKAMGEIMMKHARKMQGMRSR